MTAVKDEHRIIAMNSKSGDMKWSFFAGARIDSPPSISHGYAVFGSRDGWVYCLNAYDGQLVWKRRLAADNKLIGAFGQLESIWPVHGSVLIKDSIVYACAGRSSYLDHGIMAYALDLKTGSIKKQKRIYSLDPKTGKMLPEFANTEQRGEYIGAISDILKIADNSVYMGVTELFGGNIESKNVLNPNVTFLDRTWANRTTWGFGKANNSQLMVFNNERACGIRAYGEGKGAFFTPGKDKYKLFAEEKGKNNKIWEKEVSVRFRAMVLAKDKLFAIGPPDIVKPDDPCSILCVYSVSNGTKLKEYKMNSIPVWNGMSAANGKLYISFKNGTIVCME